MNFDSLPIDLQWTKWEEVLSALALLDSRDRQGQLSAESLLRRSPSGTIIARLRSSGQEFSCRGKSDGREDGFIFLQQRGIGHFEDGSFIDDGAVSVCDALSPWRMAFEGAFEILVLRIQRKRFAEPLGRRLIGAPTVLANGPLLPGIQALLRSLLRDLDHLDDTEIASMENALLELVTAALRRHHGIGNVEVTQVQAAHFQRITALIIANLSQTDLTMRGIARMGGISQRYLQKLFELHDTTCSEFVRSLRLDRARDALLQESQHSASIAEIAFRCGFGNPGHFSRTFKAAFGMSPQACRNSAQPSVVEPTLRRGRPTGMRSDKIGYIGSSPADGTGSVTLASRRHIAANADTVHWGFLSKDLPPVMHINSGAEVTVETLTQHASDDWERMVRDDPGAESVFHWTTEGKNVERRGAGPLNASVFGRGAGEGFGVHILTGPIFVEDAEPGDILEINILDISPRPSGNPEFTGRCFASNASTWWGYHYTDFIDKEDKREIVTIFEVDPGGASARAVYSYRWTPQIDPYGISHDTIDYPGVPVDHSTIEKRENPIPGVRIPLRPHFGVMAVMPKENGLVDSVPPGNFGGNFDNWRAGPGSTFYLPVAVPGALFSVGDGHLALGDGEINGTGLECSLTGTFRFILHKRDRETKPFLRGLAGPLVETPDELILHGFSYPNYLRDLGQDAQAEVYKKSCLDHALRSAFHSSRKFLMDCWGLDEDAAVTVLSSAGDFGITQVANGNLGVHVVIPKSILLPNT